MNFKLLILCKSTLWGELTQHVVQPPVSYAVIDNAHSLTNSLEDNFLAFFRQVSTPKYLFLFTLLSHMDSVDQNL